MAIEVSEREMLERFVDGIKKSASASKEIRTEEFDKRPKIFVKFLEGLKVAAGSAHQLAHSQQNHQWLSLRDILENVIEKSQTLVTFNSSANKSWESIETSLNFLVEKGKKIAASVSMKRADLLAGLTVREMAVQEQLREEHGTETVH